MKQQPVSNQAELTIQWKYFLVFFLLLLTNFASLSVFKVQIPPLRFLRQPSVVLALLFILHFLESTEVHDYKRAVF
mgnify:CR=1 FL=1